MKDSFVVALGMRLQAGAFGGGNQFGDLLTKYLLARGITVVSDLERSDIDIILLTDSRPWLATTAFAGTAALAYKKHHPETKIIFRVNECDEKRGARLKLLNKLLAAHIQEADQVVYISHWLGMLFNTQFPNLKTAAAVIWNGADETVFHNREYQIWQAGTPLKLVTHHWSSNFYKGFDVYYKLDELLQTTFKGQLEMTYIGNVPSDVHFKVIKVLAPQSGAALATSLRQHHAYITASQFEPAGMHHIEAAMCGLPLIYRQSGALPEYCRDFGIGFEGPSDLATALTTIMRDYPTIQPQLAAYDNTATKMCEAYYKLLLTLQNSAPAKPASLAATLKIQALSTALFAKETLNSLVK